MKKSVRGLTLLVMLTSALPMPARQGLAQAQGKQNSGTAWSELEHAMGRMHTGMRSVEPSGNDDADFVRLMLPHHQAALDMAKTELVHGRDPQMRRLAQEIVADQQSEMELMQLWLKQHELNTQK